MVHAMAPRVMAARTSGASLLAALALAACSGDGAAPSDAGLDSAPVYDGGPHADADAAPDASFDAGADAPPPKCAPDAGFDFSSMSDRVKRATEAAQGQGDRNCAAWLPEVAATTPAEMRAAVRGLVARLFGVAPNDVM